MRILLVSEDLPGEQIGGLGKHVVTLGNALLAQGHAVRILGRSDCGGGAAQVGFQGHFEPGFDYAHPGWKEKQLGVFNPLKRPYFARKIAQAIARHANGADVVHYHGHLPMVGLYLDPAMNFVQTRHDQGSECMIHLRFREGAVCAETGARACAACAHRQPGPVRTAVSAHAVARYRTDTARTFARHKTIFVSDFLRRQFLRAVPDADLSRTRVIHNFIDYGRLAALAARAGPPRAGQVLVAGRIDTGKGFGEFLAAVEGRLPPAARVLVAGDGPLRAALAARFASEQVRFLGWRANPEIVALTATSHACVVPSVWEEPCGTTILEALALGRPCVALARGGTPELAAYAAHPGQLRLSEAMDGLVDNLLAELARPPVAAPLPARAQMDVFQALPRILDFYAE
jgi:glycosyltransferase involved in cell wall biosynthesis